MTGDDVCIDRESEYVQAVLERVFPNRYVPFGELFSAPDVVNKNIESPLLTIDALDQRLHLRRIQMIDLDRDRAPTFLFDQGRRLLDRLRSIHLGALRRRRAPGAINSSARCAKLNRNPTPRAARRSGC